MKKKTYRIMGFITALALTLGSYFSVQASAPAAPMLSGTAYFVSVDGNDANACTSSAPCKTFERAQDLAGAGDVIYMGAYPPFTVTKAGLTVSGAQVDGSGQSQSLCIQVKADNVTIDNAYVVNCESHGIILFNANDTVKNSTVEHSILQNYPVGKLSSGWGSAFKAERGSSNSTFENDNAIGNFGEGFGITMAAGSTLIGNTAADNYHANYYFDNSYSVVAQDNLATCTINNLDGFALGEEYYSGWGAQAHDITIQNNTIENCYDGIIIWNSDVGGTTTNVTIDGNVVPSGQDFAISLDEKLNNNVMVSNNRIWKTNIWVRSKAGVTLTNNTLYIAETNTPTPVPPTQTNTATPTPTMVVPSFTPTQTPTNTPTLTDTPTPTPVTPSPVPPSPTPLPPTATPTDIPPTATPTNIPPTATPTNVPPTATPTDIPPTATLQPTPLATVSAVTYDDTNSDFTYSSGWQEITDQQALDGSFKSTTRRGATISLTFTGQSFSILYTQGPKYKGMSVYVDGMLVGNINEKGSVTKHQDHWDYAGQLPPGSHTLQLVTKNSPHTEVSFDGVIVQ